MSNNKQSSVEWLFEQIKNHIDAEDGSMGMNWLHDGTFEQAKAIEKQQRMSDFSMGIRNAIQMEATKDAEKWFLETFGGNNEQQ